MDELFTLMQSPRVRDREKYLRLGAEITVPEFVLSYSAELGRESYNKLLLTANGACDDTTCPVGLLLVSEDWRVWQLTSLCGKHVFIAYNPNATLKNKWYEQTLVKLPYKLKVPALYGDVVVFKHDAPIVWDELAWRRELINFLVMHYGHKSGYKFCEH